MSSQPVPYSGGFIENAPVVTSFISADETDPEITTLIQLFKASFAHREVDGHNSLHFFCTCTIPTNLLTVGGIQSAPGEMGVRIGLVGNDVERSWCTESTGLKAQHAVDEAIRYAFPALGWIGPVSSEKREPTESKPDSLHRFAQACREAATIEGDTPEATRDRRLVYARHGVPTRLNFTMMQGDELKTFPANGPNRENGRLMATCDESRIIADYEGLENPAFKYLTSFSTPRGGEPLASGEAGIAFDIIDLDRHGEIDGVAAFDGYLKSKELSLEELLSTCLWSQTKSQGIHIFIKHLGALSRSVAFEGDLKGVEIKSLRSFETLPNSFCRAWSPAEKRTVAEASYILKGTGDVVESGPYYEAFRNLLQRPELHRDKPKNAAFPPNFVATTSSEWERNTLRNCLVAIVDKQTDNVANAGEGGRNIALYSAVKTVAGHAANYERDFPDVIGCDVVFDRFLSASEQCGLGREEAEATIKSGWKAGYSAPLAPIPAIKRSPVISAEPPQRKWQHNFAPHQEKERNEVDRARAEEASRGLMRQEGVDAVRLQPKDKPPHVNATTQAISTETFRFDPPSVDIGDFPLWALGKDGQRWVNAIAKTRKAHPVLIATQLLGVMAGVAQELADVTPARGGVHGPSPLSLYTVGVAGTSGGKSTVKNNLSVGLRRYEKLAGEEYKKAMKQYRLEMAQYTEAVNKLVRKGSSAEQIDDMPVEPEHPADPQFCFKDGTVEGLIKNLQDNRPRVLLFNDEASQLFCGYNMSGDSRARALAYWCSFWSGEAVDLRLSGSDKAGVKIKLDGYRVSWALSTQTEILPELLRQDMIRSGLSPRILLCNAPVVEDKIFPYQAHMDMSDLDDFHERSQHLLTEAPIRDIEGNRPLLVFDAEAMNVYERVFYKLEAEMKEKAADGAAEFRNKLFENAMRIAAVLTVWEKGAVVGDELNWRPNTIDASTLERGITLARWYVRQWESLVCDGVRDLVNEDAEVIMNALRSGRIDFDPKAGYRVRKIQNACGTRFRYENGSKRIRDACDKLCRRGNLEISYTKNMTRDGKTEALAVGYFIVSRD